MPEGNGHAMRSRRPNDSLPDILRAKLKLNGAETRVMLRLIAWQSMAHEQTAATASVKLNSVNAIIYGLRRKLAKYKITINAVHGVGFELRRESRERILKMLFGPGSNSHAKPAHFARAGYNPTPAKHESAQP
jgi:hypothetical protein